PQQILTASGGVKPYAFTLTGGSLPGGITLSNGSIGGTPSVSGSFSVTVTVTDSATPPAQASANLALTIRPFAADLVLSAGSLSFALASGAAVPPPSASVNIISGSVLQQLNYSISVTPAASWLSVVTGGTTPSALAVSITHSALTLLAGSVRPSILLTC